MSRPSWIQASGIPSGKLGDVVDGIRIIEANRATVYEDCRKGIEELQAFLVSNYTNKGVKAVLYGITSARKTQEFAVFCQDGFITNVHSDCN